MQILFFFSKDFTLNVVLIPRGRQWIPISYISRPRVTPLDPDSSNHTVNKWRTAI